MTTIFAEFKIEWPPEIIQLMNAVVRAEPHGHPIPSQALGIVPSFSTGTIPLCSPLPSQPLPPPAVPRCSPLFPADPRCSPRRRTDQHLSTFPLPAVQQSVFSVDVSVVSPECTTEITPFQFWFGQTILPFVFAMIMGSVLVVVTLIFWMMQHTRLPIWARRKFSKRLRPPRLQVATDADSLGDRVTKKLFNQIKLLRYSAIAAWTVPIGRDQMEQYYDTMLNAIITILSIYYLTGCSKALGVFRCQDADYIEVINNVTGLPSLEPRKRQLAGSFAGQVVCEERRLRPDNTSLTEWEAEPWDTPWVPPGAGNPIPLGTPPYRVIFAIGAFFFYSYAFGLPIFLGTKLYLGRHRLNDLRFGRKFGYLYKRYEVGWYAWELMVMARKVSCLQQPRAAP